MIPVGDARQEHVVEVLENGRERLRLVGRRGRQGSPDSAGLDAREYRQVADALQVASSPLERGSPVGAKVAHRPTFGL